MNRSESRASRRFLGLVWVGAVCAVWCGGSQAALAQSVPAILGPDGPAIDFFGYAISVSGDVALVGAQQDDDKGLNSGSAYVFRRGGSTWVKEQKLLGSDEVAYDGFGSTVAIDRDTAVVRAPSHVINSNAGAAYVYRYNGSSWVQEQELLAADGAGTDYFGFSVAASSDMVVVGAYQDDNKGSAYVFGWNGSSWVQLQKLLASDGAAYDSFRSAVSVTGDVAVVGAYQNSSKGLVFGSAYVFRFNGSTWIQETELYASDGATNDYFGSSVAVSGDMVVVGAYQDDDKGSQSGSAYVFRFNGTTWTQETKLLDANGRSNDRFGYSVAASGSRAVVGAYWANSIGGDAGAAFVFGQSPGCLTNAYCGDTNDYTTDVCNTTDGTCSNTPKPPGTICRAAAGGCDVTENCTGTSATCPSDVVTPNGTECGSPATTDCDNPDTCNNGLCVDNYDPSGTPCTDDGNPATSDLCNGSGTCQHVPTTCPDDGKPFTNDVLSGGICTHPSKANSTLCKMSGTYARATNVALLARSAWSKINRHRDLHIRERVLACYSRQLAAGRMSEITLCEPHFINILFLC